MAITIDFSGKVVMITGAAGGIGKGAAKYFAQAGATLVLTDMQDKVEQVAADFVAQGITAIAIVADISNAQACQGVVDAAMEKFGRLDFAFNNAGIGGAASTMDEMDMDAFNHVMNINLSSVAQCMKYQVAAMKKTGGGVIINNSSIAGLMPLDGQSFVYSTSKHAVIGLTKQAAINLAPDNIRVNAVCPGLILTDLTTGAKTEGADSWFMNKIPMGRSGTTDDVGRAVVTLCSDLNGYVTGVAMPVDGGFLLS